MNNQRLIIKIHTLTEVHMIERILMGCVMININMEDYQCFIFILCVLKQIFQKNNKILRVCEVVEIV